MSMRALVLLIGLLVTGDAGAAVNAPLSVEPSGAEPREDLFASKPRNAAPAAPPALPAPPAAPAAERAATGNPLWAIPLSRLPATREQPLFSPTRQPPPVAAVARPAPAPMAPPPKPAEPETPQLSLLGTIAGGGKKIGLFIDSAKNVLRLQAGENHKGWTLRSVSPREVELARGLDTAVLVLAPPDTKAGAAPPVMPTLAAAPAAPGAVLPVNTANATGAAHKAMPPGLERPVFQPPPAQVNPFQQPNAFGQMPAKAGSR